LGPDSRTVEVKNSTFSNFRKNGITANYGGLTANIHDNIITGRGEVPAAVQNGIQYGWGATGTASKNTISDMADTDGTWTACGIFFYGAGGTANGNTITDCETGIQFEERETDSYTATVENNIISASGLSSSLAWTVGISLETFDTSSLTATINGNDLSIGGPAGAGISIGEDAGGDSPYVDATISNNEISGWYNGIWLGLSCDEVTITGNTIANNVGVTSGVHIISGVDVTSVQAHFNNIVGNEGYGINNGGTGTLDATNNWWGCNGGPGETGCDTVSANVDADPWIQFTLGANPTQIVADGTSQSNLTAKLKNSDNTIVAPNTQLNQLPEFAKVTFTTDKGAVGSSSVTKELTDGQAAATLTSSTTVETATVTAQAKDDSEAEISGATHSTMVDFIAGASSTVTLTAEPTNITADGTSTSLLTATVRDEHGNPVADDTNVVFETDHGAFASSTVTKQTTNGVATATLTSESSEETIIATIIATATNGASDAAAVFFIPELVADAGGPYTGIAGTAVSLSGSASGGIPPYSYAWDLDGDGDYDDSFAQNPSYTWTTANGYTVGLQVTDSADSIATDTASVHIWAAPPPPAVGGTAYPVNKLGILAPWIGIALAIMAGAAIFMRRRRAQG
jgi:Bacterial Ig-like domain (group 1).